MSWYCIFKAVVDVAYKIRMCLLIHWKICFSQVNNSIHVNSVDVPKSDLMAKNGVIHVVKNVLYPAGENSMHYDIFMQCAHCAGRHYVMFWWCILFTDLPVGRQDLLVLLKKLIKYIQIKVEKENIFICLNMYRSKIIFLLFFVCLYSYSLSFWYAFCSLVCFWIFLCWDPTHLPQ